MSPQPKPNKTNANGRIFAIIAYLLPVIGGIIGLASNRDNPLTRNHAQQSIGAVLTLIVGFFTWAVMAYLIALIPAIRPAVIVLTYILIVVGFLASLYYLSKLDVDDNVQMRLRQKGVSRLVWMVGIYGVGGVIYFLSQTSPETVEFAVPVIELLAPVSELFMPVLLLITILILGGGILPSILSTLLTLMIAVNMLTWMPLAGPVIAVAIYALVIALFVFLIFNWVFGLISAIQGHERVIPIANNLTKRIFGKAKMTEATAT